MKIGFNKKYFRFSFILVFFLACLAFFGIFLRYHLFFQEQLQIFLLSPDHFFKYFSKPAALSSYAGDFLIQFFYLRGGGAIVITATLLILWISVKTLLGKLAGREVSLYIALIPVILGWISLCRIEHPLSAETGLIFGILFTLIYLSLKPGLPGYLTAVFLLPILYIAAGSSFYILSFAVILKELKNRTAGRLIRLVLVLLITVIIPVALKETYLITVPQAFTWISQMRKSPGIIDLLPLFSVLATMLFIAIPNKESESGTSSLFFNNLFSIPAIVLLAAGIILVSDFSFEKILRLDYEASHNRWEKVYSLTKKYKTNNSVVTYYSNLAMSKMGVMADELMECYQPAATGLFIPVNANENYITITFSNEVYWHLGDVNASQHSALLGMIFSPRSENSRLMKRLVEINIVNGEYAAAGKFITILEKTLFHRKWAGEMRNYLFNEEACEGSYWIKEKRSQIPVRDMLKKGNEYILTLRMLLDNHPENKMAADYLLSFHLLSKDIPSFASDFEKYYSPWSKRVIPRAYQEGLLIWIASGKADIETLKKYIFSPEVIHNFTDYTKIYEENQGKGASLQEKYGKTYWFYFHFATLKNI
jgi:hypothetical protein